MDSIRPAIPGVTGEGGQAPAHDAPDEPAYDPAAIRPTPLDDAAAAISGVVPEPTLAHDEVPVSPDDERNDPEAFDPPLLR